jgi:hypothetical protein
LVHQKAVVWLYLMEQASEEKDATAEDPEEYAFYLRKVL